MCVQELNAVSADREQLVQDRERFEQDRRAHAQAAASAASAVGRPMPAAGASPGPGLVGAGVPDSEALVVVSGAVASGTLLGTPSLPPAVSTLGALVRV